MTALRTERKMLSWVGSGPRHDSVASVSGGRWQPRVAGGRSLKTQRETGDRMIGWEIGQGGDCYHRRSKPQAGSRRGLAILADLYYPSANGRDAVAPLPLDVSPLSPCHLAHVSPRGGYATALTSLPVRPDYSPRR